MSEENIMSKCFFMKVLKGFSKRLKVEQKTKQLFLLGENVPELLGNAIRSSGIKEGRDIGKDYLEQVLEKIGSQIRCSLSWMHESTCFSYVYPNTNDYNGSIAIASLGETSFSFDLQIGDEEMSTFLESDDDEGEGKKKAMVFWANSNFTVTFSSADRFIKLLKMSEEEFSPSHEWSNVSSPATKKEASPSASVGVAPSSVAAENEGRGGVCSSTHADDIPSLFFFDLHFSSQQLKKRHQKSTVGKGRQFPQERKVCLCLLTHQAGLLALQLFRLFCRSI